MKEYALIAMLTVLAFGAALILAEEMSRPVEFAATEGMTCAQTWLHLECTETPSEAAAPAPTPAIPAAYERLPIIIFSSGRGLACGGTAAWGTCIRDWETVAPWTIDTY